MIGPQLPGTGAVACPFFHLTGIFHCSMAMSTKMLCTVEQGSPHTVEWVHNEWCQTPHTPSQPPKSRPTRTNLRSPTLSRTVPSNRLLNPPIHRVNRTG
eukprot:scaffold102_cov340-Pavlova_lutheri.AAC.31